MRSLTLRSLTLRQLRHIQAALLFYQDALVGPRIENWPRIEKTLKDLEDLQEVIREEIGIAKKNRDILTKLKSAVPSTQKALTISCGPPSVSFSHSNGPVQWYWITNAKPTLQDIIDVQGAEYGEPTDALKIKNKNGTWATAWVSSKVQPQE